MRTSIVLALLGAMVLFYFVGNYLLTPVIRTMHEEGLIPGTEEEWRVYGGLLKTVPNIIGMILMFFWAILADKMGRQRVILVLSVLMAASLVLVSTASNYASLLLYFTIFGIGMVGISPVVYAFVADIVPSERRGAGYAVYYAASVFGMVLGLAIGALIYWREAYLIAGISIVLTSIPLYVLSRSITIGFAEQTSIGEFSFKKVLLALRSRTLIIVLGQQLLWTIPWGMLALWSVDYIMTRWGLSKTSASLILIVATISIALGHIVGGLLSDRYVKKGDVLGRVKVSIIGITLGYLAMIAMLSYPYPYGDERVTTMLFPMILAALGMMFTTFAYPNINSVISDVVKPEVRSTVFSIYNIINTSGWALGPIIYGLMVKYLMGIGMDERTALLYSAVSLVSLWIGSLIAWILISRTYPRERIYAKS